jgi:hypothetical protein
MCRLAAGAVFAKFSEMEEQRNTPVLCVTITNKSIKNIADRTEFEAAWNFEILTMSNNFNQRRMNDG